MDHLPVYVVKLHRGINYETVIVNAETAYDAQELALKQFPGYKTTSIFRKKEDWGVRDGSGERKLPFLLLRET